MSDLRYPIGPVSEFPRDSYNDRHEYVEFIGAFPQLLKEKTQGLRPDALRLPYRPDGWSILQVVHHCADSHLNAYTRFRLALTEYRPHIRPYQEHLWAQLADAVHPDLTPSLQILSGVHCRWHQLLESMTEADWNRTYLHPEYKDEYNLLDALAQYVWHGKHHLGHIDQALRFQESFPL